MACNCKDANGSLLDKCLGICGSKEFKTSDAVQIRAEKTIEDRIEYLLGVFMNNLDKRFHHIEQMSMQHWKNGYKEGLEDGRNDF